MLDAGSLVSGLRFLQLPEQSADDFAAGIEIFLLPRASMRWLDALPFAAVFVLKTLVYGAIAGAVLAGQPGERLLGVVTVYNARTGLIAVCLSLVPVAVVVMMFQAAGLVGYRTFMALLLGKYRRPYAERRFFLFVDVVGSTAIAERLGALEAHRLASALTRLNRSSRLKKRASI